MPLRVGEFIPMETLPLSKRLKGDACFQAYWYKHACQFVQRKTVLDAGAGTGYGIGIMTVGGASVVEGFDLLPAGMAVKHGKIEDYADSSWDAVVSLDVIEHVPEDVKFLSNLLRVARESVIISTPNWLFSKAQNAHHFREYTPAELMDLIDSFKSQWREVRYWVGDVHCSITERGQRLLANDDGLNFCVLITK